jgi:hypothetical protein
MLVFKLTANTSVRRKKIEEVAYVLRNTQYEESRIQQKTDSKKAAN